MGNRRIYDREYRQNPMYLFPEYSISKTGIVVQRKYDRPVNIDFPKKDPILNCSVHIINKDGKLNRYKIKDLLVWAFYGKCDLPIVVKQNAPFPIECLYYGFFEYYFPKNEDTISLLKNKKATIGGELFRRCPEPYTDYFISKQGVVFDAVRWKFCSRHYGYPDEYPAVNLRNANDSGVQNNVFIHILLIKTWKPNEYDSDKVIDHLDGRKFNSVLSNLEVVTNAENTKRALEKGLILKKANRTFLNEDVIRKLCEGMQEGLSNFQLRKYANIPNEYDDGSLVRLLHGLRSGKNYKYITKDYDFSSWDRRLNHISERNRNREDVVGKLSHIRKVCELLANSDMTNIEISNITGVNKNTVQNIRSGKQYKDIAKEYGVPEWTSSKRTYSKETVERVFQYMSENPRLSTKMIAVGLQEYGLTESDISTIYRSNKNKPEDQKYHVIRNDLYSKNRLNDDEVLQICIFAMSGCSAPDIINRMNLNVSKQSIDAIIHGETHRNISVDICNLPENLPKVKLCGFHDYEKKIVCECIEDLYEKMSDAKIAKEASSRIGRDVRDHQIRFIKNGKMWKEYTNEHEYRFLEKYN